VPEVFAGKYGSYSSWLGAAVQSEGFSWLVRLLTLNLQHLTELGWATVGVAAMPLAVRWTATVFLTGVFALGWARLVRRAPVTALVILGYMILVLLWPFAPARFVWAIWPLVGLVFFLAMEWMVEAAPSRAARLLVLAAFILPAAGYVAYNVQAVHRGWWNQVQNAAASRARALAEWVSVNTSPDAVLSTDDDVLIYLYTGRRAIPNGTFTPQEHLKPQTPEFTAETLRRILASYRVDYVLVSSQYGTYAARGLLQAQPPELSLVQVLTTGAVFATTRSGK
jgi:hypothetical protein